MTEYPGYDIDRFESEGGVHCGRCANEDCPCHLEAIPVIDLDSEPEATNARKKERDEH